MIIIPSVSGSWTCFSRISVRMRVLHLLLLFVLSAFNDDDDDDDDSDIVLQTTAVHILTFKPALLLLFFSCY